MLVLHEMHISGNCYKVRLAARQTNTPLALKDYPLHGGETRLPPFLRRNPNGRVPLLEFEGGRGRAEPGPILWHLADGTSLIPDGRWDRARMLQWMFFEQYSHE